MPRIFINYRREDSVAYAGRIYDLLVSHFGDQSVFMDLENLNAGDDFLQLLRVSITSCDHFVAVIGRQWASITDAFGRPRIADPNDIVGLEISTALQQTNLYFVPVLVNGATMPKSGQLPSRLLDLARRQALELPDRGFREAVDGLIKLIDQPKTIRNSPQSPSPTKEEQHPRPASRQAGDGGPNVRTLPEELYLLSIDSKTGYNGWADKLGARVAMAVMGELVLRGRLSLEPGLQFAVRDLTRTGDPLLDAALDGLTRLLHQSSSSSLNIASFLEVTSYQRVRDELLRKGVLERKVESSWIFFERTLYPLAGTTLQNEQLLRFSSAVEGLTRIDERMAILIAIISTDGPLESPLKLPFDKIWARAVDIQKDNELCRAIREVLDKRFYVSIHPAGFA